MLVCFHLLFDIEVENLMYQKVMVAEKDFTHISGLLVQFIRVNLSHKGSEVCL